MLTLDFMYTHLNEPEVKIELEFPSLLHALGVAFVGKVTDIFSLVAGRLLYKIPD